MSLTTACSSVYTYSIPNSIGISSRIHVPDQYTISRPHSVFSNTNLSKPITTLDLPQHYLYTYLLHTQSHSNQAQNPSPVQIKINPRPQPRFSTYPYPNPNHLNPNKSIPQKITRPSTPKDPTDLPLPNPPSPPPQTKPQIRTAVQLSVLELALRSRPELRWASGRLAVCTMHVVRSTPYTCSREYMYVLCTHVRVRRT